MNPYETLRLIARHHRDPYSTHDRMIRRRALTAAWALRPATEVIHEERWGYQPEEGGQVAHEFEQTHAKAIELLRGERVGFFLMTLANTEPRRTPNEWGADTIEILTVHSCYVYARRRELTAFWSRVKELADSELSKIAEIS